MLNSRSIDDLRPDVAANCRIWMELCRVQGLNVLVTGTVRDEEYQLYCYNNGTSKAKVPSFHSVKAGLAFDFCKNVKGHEYDDLTFFSKAAAIAKEMGFEWGGGWKSFPDRPHLQWSDGGKYTSAMVRAGNYPPTMPLYETEDTDMTEERVKAIVAEGVKAAQPTMYTSVQECPEWARSMVQEAVDKGLLQGDQAGRLHLSDDNLVCLQLLKNLQLF